MSGTPVEVLVVGAGPVGLALALDVAAHGGSVRIVERRNDPWRPSRAMMVHPRTLEVLRPLGVIDDVLARSDTSPAADVHVGRRIVSVQLGGIGLTGTAFPHLTMVRQRDVEEVLAGAIQRHGVDVEWGSQLAALSYAGGDEVRATVQSASGSEDVVARFVVGCDGTASTVRGLLGIAWPGRYYAVEVVLADVDLSGPSDRGGCRSPWGPTGWCSSSLWGRGPRGGSSPPASAARGCPDSRRSQRPWRSCRHWSTGAASAHRWTMSRG